MDGEDGGYDLTPFGLAHKRMTELAQHGRLTLRDLFATDDPVILAGIDWLVEQALDQTQDDGCC